MSFGEPQLLYGLAIIPVMALLVAWSSRRARSAVGRLGDPALIARLSESMSLRGRRVRTLLWFLAIVLILLAWSRPRWGSEVQLVERQGIQVIVALDVSRSMLAEDIKPNRLSRAKLEIVDLMRQLDGDDIGLVLFSGASFLQFPLTFDYATARTFLEAAGPGMISRPGTAIADAIDTALASFDSQRPSQNVIVIMTDGEGHEGDPLAAARRAVDEGAIIHTVGFGSPQGEPIPEYGAGGLIVRYKQNRNGEMVLSRLDEVTLQRIAREAGGRYFRAGDGGAIRDLVDELDGLQKATGESELETRNVERFQGFLLLALVALIAIELIPERPARWIPRRGLPSPSGLVRWRPRRG